MIINLELGTFKSSNIEVDIGERDVKQNAEAAILLSINFYQQQKD